MSLQTSTLDISHSIKSGYSLFRLEVKGLPWIPQFIYLLVDQSGISVWADLWLPPTTSDASVGFWIFWIIIYRNDTEFPEIWSCVIQAFYFRFDRAQPDRPFRNTVILADIKNASGFLLISRYLGYNPILWSHRWTLHYQMSSRRNKPSKSLYLSCLKPVYNFTSSHILQVHAHPVFYYFSFLHDEHKASWSDAIPFLIPHHIVRKLVQLTHAQNHPLNPRLIENKNQKSCNSILMGSTNCLSRGSRVILKGKLNEF